MNKNPDNVYQSFWKFAKCRESSGKTFVTSTLPSLLVSNGLTFLTSKSLVGDSR